MSNDSRTATNCDTAKEGDISIPPTLPDEICQCGGCCHAASATNRAHRLRGHTVNGVPISRELQQQTHSGWRPRPV